ncbi:MUC18 protein, partial [Smithornis capensis]|nr:MUC18 protein [Smithornis capensis]
AASKLEVSMPAVVEVEFGGTARIPCDFSIPGNGSYSYIDWFYLDQANSRVRLCRITDSEVLKEDTEYKGRLSVGADKALSISKVTLQDARTFVCQVGAGSSDVGESRTELTVYSEGGGGSLLPPAHGSTLCSRPSLPSQIAKCESKNSFPFANITWHKNGEQLDLQESQVKVTRIRESNGLFTVTSLLSAPVTREDRDSQYHCTAHYWLRGQRHTQESRRVKINVFYPAEHLTLQVVPPLSLVKEGDNVKLICEADGNPPPVFTFYKRQVRLEGTWPALFSIPLLDIEGVHVEVEPPSPVLEGQSVTLSCDAHSLVTLAYEWSDGKGRKLGEGNQLVVSNLTFETPSNFSCKVMAPSVPGLEQSKQVAVTVEGEPRIVGVSSPLYVRQDEVVNLTCKAIAVPKPSFHWNVNGTVRAGGVQAVISLGCSGAQCSSASPLQAHEFVDKQHVTSNLTVRVNHDLLKAGATCRVSNSKGSSQKFIQLLASFPSGLLCPGPAPEHPLRWSPRAQPATCPLWYLKHVSKLSPPSPSTKPEARKDKIVVEVKSDKVSEEAGLLQGANGDKRPATDQVGRGVGHCP